MTPATWAASWQHGDRPLRLTLTVDADDEPQARTRAWAALADFLAHELGGAYPTSDFTLETLARVPPPTPED